MAQPFPEIVLREKRSGIDREEDSPLCQSQWIGGFLLSPHLKYLTMRFMVGWVKVQIVINTSMKLRHRIACDLPFSYLSIRLLRYRRIWLLPIGSLLAKNHIGHDTCWEAFWAISCNALIECSDDRLIFLHWIRHCWSQRFYLANSCCNHSRFFY